MKTIMPKIEEHLVAEQSWWTLATMVYKQHGGDMVLHIVTDPTDKDTFVPSLKKFNGVEGPHGFYQFQDVIWAPATRDSTATALRAAVEHNNPQAFSKAAGVDANTMIAGQPFFELVKHYMAPYLQASAEKESLKAKKEKEKAEKEKQKAEKAAMKQTKTKGPAQELAERNLKELSTELLGKYKKAAYADAKKADAEGDYARGDKRFKGINRATKKQFDNDLKKHGQQSVSEVKQRLDPKCWKGKHKEGTKIKGGVRVNNCVPNEGRVRIGQALEEIYEAKARGTISKIDKDAIPNLTRYDQLNNSDSYTSYRFGIALAPSPDFTDMDRKSAIANSFAMVDYTEADAKIRRGAEKTMGVKSNSSTGKGSVETNDVNTVSPTAKLKRNKYGI
jgi:hypothetical protein